MNKQQMLKLAEKLIKQANTIKEGNEVPINTILETRWPSATGQSSYKSKVITCLATGRVGHVLRTNRKYLDEETRLQYYKDTWMRKKWNHKYYKKHKEKINERAKLRYTNNREKALESKRRNYKRNQEEKRQWQKDYRIAKKIWITVQEYRQTRAFNINNNPQCQSSEHQQT